MWLIWAFWCLFLVSKLPMGQIIISVLDSVLVKSAIWILPLLFFRNLTHFCNGMDFLLDV